jgi:hypothetical protein
MEMKFTIFYLSSKNVGRKVSERIVRFDNHNLGKQTTIANKLHLKNIKQSTTTSESGLCNFTISKCHKIQKAHSAYRNKIHSSLK